MKNKIVLSILGLVSVTILAGCSLQANLENIGSENLNSPDDVSDLIRREPDFISGELVTTTNNYQIKGTFGEIAEKKTLSNGYTFEGVFYE